MGVKYEIKYHNNEWRAEIDVPNYEGEIISCRGVGQKAIEISYEEDMHIMSSKANISFYTKEDIYDLQICNDLEVEVRVYKNNVLYWKGFLIADGLKQYDRDIESEVDIIASDGLNNSKDIKFTLGTATPIEMPTYMSEFNTPLHYLIRCFQLIKNELPIRWSVSTKSVLDINKDVLCGLISLNRTEFLLYEGVDAFFVLENILKSFNLKIMQSNGYWYVYNELDEFLGYEYNNGVVTMYQEEVVNQPEYFLTNNNTFEVRKGIGKVVISYNPIKDLYVIPNGSFNQVITSLNKPLYWKADNGLITSDTSLNDRISFRITDDFGREERSVVLDGTSNIESQIYYFESDTNNKYIPVDGHNLYKYFTFGFRMMPLYYPNNNEGYINWLENKPFSVQVSYTIERNNVIEKYFLNEFGYWELDRFFSFRLVNSSFDEILNIITLQFEGVGQIGQDVSLITYDNDGFGNVIINSDGFALPSNFNSLDETLDYLAIQYNGVNNGGGILTIPLSNISVKEPVFLVQNQQTFSTKWIDLIVEEAINGDVIEYQFQSKASQGKIELPDPDDTHKLLPSGGGYLSFAFKQIGGVRTVVDELKFSFEEATETYTMKINDNDSEEFELRIGSSFTGFDLTSYSLDFSTTKIYMMFVRNGVTATLPEHYGRDYLRLNARPRRVWTGQMKGEIKPYQITEIRGIDFVPLQVTYNTELNETSGSWIELVDNNLENLEINITNGKTKD